MYKTDDKMTNAGIMFLVTSSMLGVTKLVLPRVVTSIAGVDGIVMIPIAGIVAIIFAYFASKLSSEYPSKIVVEYVHDIVGTAPGKIYSFVLTLYMFFASGLILRIFATTIKGMMLPQTPIEIIILAFIFTSIYLIMNGISSISKVCEVFIPIVIFISLILITLPLKNFDIEELYPLFSKGIKAIPLGMGVLSIFPAFLGFEIVMFIMPFTTKENNIFKYALLGMTIPIIIYTLQMLISIGVLGLGTTKFSIYPTLEVARLIHFPGAFAERFDIFFMIFWILSSFSTFSSYFYMSALSITKLIGLEEYKPFVLVVVPIIFLISMLPQNLQETFDFNKYVGYVGMGLVSFNIILYLIHIIKKRRNIN